MLNQIDLDIYADLLQNLDGLYNGTCDIVEKTQAPDAGGVLVETITPVQLGITCRLVPIKQQAINPNESATRERDFTLYLIDSPQIKESYQFTNFTDGVTLYPNKYYKIILDTEINRVATNGALFAFTIKGLKRIDKDV